MGIDPTASIVKQVATRFEEILEKDKRRVLDDAAVYLQQPPINRLLLKEFLRNYAPPQLTEDRYHKTKIIFPSRILDSLSNTFQANRLLVLARQNNDKSTEEALAELIIVGRKAIPHIDWTKLHDVHLILAIIKHGWLDDSSAFKSIADDNDFIWANVDKSELTSDSSTFKFRYSNDIDTVRSRVLTFLNSEYPLMESLKGFGLKLILQTYDIQEDAPAHGSKRWIYKGTNTEIETFSTQRLLLKRAKTVLGRSARCDGSVAPSFIKIDKQDRRNVFIVELLHAFIKLGKTQSDLGLTLLQYAVQDAKTRTRELHMKTIAEKLHEIVSHNSIDLFTKKNIIRSILGMDEITPKRSNERANVSRHVDCKDRHTHTSNVNNMSDHYALPYPRSAISQSRNQTDVVNSKVCDTIPGRKESDPALMSDNFSTACCLLSRRMNATNTLCSDPLIALRLSNNDLLLLGILTSRGIPLRSCIDDTQNRSKFFLTWSHVADAWFHAKLSLSEIVEVTSPNDIGMKVVYLVRSMLAIISSSSPQVIWMRSQIMLWFNSFNGLNLNVGFDQDLSASTSDKSAIKGLSVVDCQCILDQIIQQTILRGIILSYDDETILRIHEKSFQTPSKWPFLWSCEDDLILMKDIVYFGYSHYPHVRDAIESRKSTAKISGRDTPLSCSDVQDRMILVTNTLFECMMSLRSNSTTIIDLSTCESDDNE